MSEKVLLNKNGEALLEDNKALIANMESGGSGGTVVAIQNLTVDPQDENRYIGNISTDDSLALAKDDSSCIVATLSENKIILKKVSSTDTAMEFAAVNPDKNAFSGVNATVTGTEVVLNIVGLELATVAISGSYNDLADKPAIPAAQVNVDWEANSGVSQILNKPAIPATTSELTNDSGFITDAALAGYATEQYVTSAIEALPEPMQFKGTVGDLGTKEWADFPKATWNNKGHTYKVITAHDTDPICAEGDTLISNGSAWIVIPSGDEPSGTVTSVDVLVPEGLKTTGGPITSAGAINIAYVDGYAIPTIAKQAEWDTKSTFSGSYSDLTDKPDLDIYAKTADLATVATSGSYTDLTDKPFIPATATDVHALPDTTTYVASLAGVSGGITIGGNLNMINNELNAVDTTYSNGTGIRLSGTTFSIDPAVVATQTNLSEGLATKQNAIQIIDLT